VSEESKACLGKRGALVLTIDIQQSVADPGSDLRVGVNFVNGG